MNLIEIIFNYKKASVMVKFTGELLHRIESKVGSSSNVEGNASNVCQVVENLDTCAVGTQVEWSVRIPSFQDMPTISSYDPHM